MSNAKSLQSECTAYSISKPKLKLQKSFVDLSPLTFDPFFLTTLHPNVCPFAPPPHLNHPTTAREPTTLHHLNPPPSSDPIQGEEAGVRKQSGQTSKKWRGENQVINETNKTQLLSNIKKKQNYQNFKTNKISNFSLKVFCALKFKSQLKWRKIYYT